jgi:RNA polymerase sigma-70 factor (ECF subfamily)
MASPDGDPPVDFDAVLGLDAAADAGEPAGDDVVLGLFDQCAPAVVRYAASFGLRREAAEDIAQDVFLALFRHLNLGRPRQNLRGWLFRVAHNLALRHRRRVRVREPQGAIAAPIETDPALDPEADLAAREARRRILAVLATLPERDRRCVRLRAEGLRYREIAQVLGLSLGTVANTLARAYARLEEARDA